MYRLVKLKHLIMTMLYMSSFNWLKNQFMQLWVCFSMVSVSSRGWRHLVCARYASLWKSRACRASLPTISPQKLQRWLPGMPSTTESATCSRPAARTLGVITQHGLGEVLASCLVQLCHCYLSASLVWFLFVSPLVIIQWFSSSFLFSRDL